jgi:DNA-binding transcriptional regulator YiaG
MAHLELMNQEEELDRLKTWTCSEVCHYLAMKVRRHRREAGVSQAEFATQAGIPLRTFKRFEAHGKANLETFVEVLRAMERTHYLLMLFPAPVRLSPTTTLYDRLRSARARGLGAAMTESKDGTVK